MTDDQARPDRRTIDGPWVTGRSRWEPGFRHHVDRTMLGWRCLVCDGEFRRWPADDEACPGPGRPTLLEIKEAEIKRLQYALDDIEWGGTHMDVRATMQNALDQARAALDRVRALHHLDDLPDEEPGCAGCHWQWPCPTIAALDGGQET